MSWPRTVHSITLLILITVFLAVPLVIASIETADSFGEAVNFIELPYPSASSEWDDSWLKSDWTAPDTLRTNSFAFWSAALSGKVSRPAMDRRGLQESFIKGWLREGKRAAEVLRVFGTPATVLPLDSGQRWQYFNHYYPCGYKIIIDFDKTTQVIAYKTEDYVEHQYLQILEDLVQTLATFGDTRRRSETESVVSPYAITQTQSDGKYRIIPTLNINRTHRFLKGLLVQDILFSCPTPPDRSAVEAMPYLLAPGREWRGWWKRWKPEIVSHLPQGHPVEVSLEVKDDWAHAQSIREAVGSYQSALWHYDDLDEVLYFYNRAIEKYPYLPDIYESRGKLYEDKGDLGLAKKDFERARRLRDAIR